MEYLKTINLLDNTLETVAERVQKFSIKKLYISS